MLPCSFLLLAQVTDNIEQLDAYTCTCISFISHEREGGHHYLL